MSHAVCSTRRHFLCGVAAPAPTLPITKKKRTPRDRNKALSKGSRGRGIQLMLWKEYRGSSRSIAGSGCERTRTPTLPTQALPCLLFCAPCGSSPSLSDAWMPHLHTTGLKSAQTDNTLPHVCPRSPTLPLPLHMCLTFLALPDLPPLCHSPILTFCCIAKHGADSLSSSRQL